MFEPIQQPEIDTLAETPARPRRRLPRMLGTVALVVGVGVVSSLTTVWATHDFPDVPGSSPHHADISWAVDNDITQGYSDGTFRPTQAVSRQTMATFLRRLNAQFTIVQESTTAGDSSAWVSSANCDPGQRAIAGGLSHSSSTATMTDSYPGADTWYGRIRGSNGASVEGVTITVYALCAPGL